MGTFPPAPHPGLCQAPQVPQQAGAEQTRSRQHAWGRQPLPPLACAPAKTALTQGPGLGRGCSAPPTAEPSVQGGLLQPPVLLSPPCLHAQVYRAKTEGDAGALTPRMKSGTPSSSQLNLSVLGRSPSPKVWLPGGAGCCAAPGTPAAAPACPAPAPVPVPAADRLPSCPGPPEPGGQPAPQPGGHAAGHRDQAPAGPAAEG